MATRRGSVNTADLRRQSRIDPGMFLQQQGGGQDAQMAMALNLLGLGEAREQAQATSEFAREQLEALIAKQTGEQELGERRLGSEERRAGEQEAFNNWVKGQTIEQNSLATEAKKEEIAAALQKSQDEFNAKAYELAAPEERPFYLKNMSPQGRAAVLEMEALKQGNTVRNLVPAVRTAYEKGDTGLIKQLTERVAPEVLQRPEFEWQKWNQGLGQRQAATDVTGGAGLLGLLWNVPGMAANLQNKALESGIKGLIGQEVDIPDIRYTSPVTPTGGAIASQVLRNVPGVSTLGQARAMAQPNPVAGPRPDVDVDSLMSLIAPQISAPQGYSPGAEFPRQMSGEEPSFEYLGGGPSAMPPGMDVLSRLRALRGLPATIQ